MKTYGYVRVSTEGQADDGNSLDVQRRQLEGRCLQDGVSLDRVFVERGVSGAKPLSERPQGKELLTALQAGDRLMAAKLDRAFRNASDALAMLEWFKDHRVDLYVLDLGGCVTSGGTSALVFGILASVAQFERGRIQERTRETKKHLLEQGRFCGGSRPFGFVLTGEGELVPHPDEQRAIATMLRLAGERRSLRAIQETVLEMHSLKISHVAIGRILKQAHVRARPAA